MQRSSKERVWCVLEHHPRRLRDVLALDTAPPPVRVARQLLSALAYLHANNIVARNVSLDAVLLDSQVSFSL